MVAVKMFVKMVMMMMINGDDDDDSDDVTGEVNLQANSLVGVTPGQWWTEPGARTNLPT